MDQTRKMWASAAVVGVIVVGGVSVAAAASAGRLEQVAKETRAVVEKASSSDESSEYAPAGQAPAEAPPSVPDQLTELTKSPEPTPDDDVVVSREINPLPGEVLEYWTDDRLRDAQPMPMPEVKPGDVIVAE
jgi:hypothetical protein